MWSFGGKNHDIRLSVQIPFLRAIRLSGVALNDKFDKDKSDDKFDYHIATMSHWKEGSLCS